MNKVLDQGVVRQRRHVTADQAMLHTLSLTQVQAIDTALTEVGPFGEVRLVKVKGQLRYIQKLDSVDAPRLQRSTLLD
jgi:hypothetical protein